MSDEATNPSSQANSEQRDPAAGTEVRLDALAPHSFSARRRMLAAAFTLVWVSIVAVLLLELVFVLLADVTGFHKEQQRFLKRRIDAPTLSVEEAREVFDNNLGRDPSIENPAVFDADLGWDQFPVARHYDPNEQHVAAAYGDSFTFGSEVSDRDTWQSQFASIRGRSIINLGVGGYGLDQAVLKFEKYATRYSTKVSILGLSSEEYRRAVSFHSYYYFSNAEQWRYVFKPVFLKSGDKVELHKPPCDRPECVFRLLTTGLPELESLLVERDYWYRKNLTRVSPGFPRFLGALRVFPEILAERMDGRAWFVNDGAKQIAQFLIDRFAAHSRETGTEPLFVMIYSVSELRRRAAGVRKDAEIVEHLERHGLPYVDSGAYILRTSPDDESLQRLSAPHGHLNGLGNRQVAEALARHPLLED